MIDRYLLRYFLAVVDHGNFSKAATACNVAQPTLSVGIAKLEQMLGHAVFNRTNRRVELTQAGVRLMTHARRIEAEFAQAEREIKDVTDQAVLRIGVLTTLPWGWVETVLTTLAADRAGHQIELVEGRERDLNDRLARGRIDVALSILRPGQGNFVQERIYSEGYSIVMPASHVLAGTPVIEAEQLSDNPMIVRRNCELLSETSRFFTARGVRPRFPARTTSDHRALQYVAAGLGVTIAPDSFRYPGIVHAHLADFNFERIIGFLFADHVDPQQALQHPALQAFTKIMTDAN